MKTELMKAELKITFARVAFFAALIAAAYFVAGCTSPKKLRDIELKGMYVNGYSEVLAIGSGRITSIPGEREALAAHYSEDTAWLSPSTKTHALDIFLVGTNSVENSKEIIASICQAFKEVAPVVSSNNAEVAKGGGTAFDVLKASGETRKAAQLAENAAEKVKSQLGSDSVGTGSDSGASGPAGGQQQASTLSDAAQTLSDPNACADGSCTTGECADGSCEVK